MHEPDVVKSKNSAKKNQERYFFTGFPGMIANTLVKRLAENRPNAHFDLFVQRKYYHQALDLARSIGATIPGFESRHQILVGDLTQRRLGLDEQTYESTRNNATEVWHLAAVGDIAAKRDVSFSVNLNGVDNILEFCNSAPQLKLFVHFSSAFVSGYRTGLVLEEELDFGQSFRSPYEESKFAGEKLVRESSGRIPTVIFRPTIVVGDSQTGITERVDGPYFLFKLPAFFKKFPVFKTSLRFPMLGRGECPINIVPVDYVADAAAHLAHNPENVGKCFHLCDQAPLTGHKLLSSIYEEFGYGAPLGFVPISFLETALKIPKMSAIIGVPPQAAAFWEHYVVFDDSQTRAALADTDIQCPAVADYLANLIQFLTANPDFSGKARY